MCELATVSRASFYRHWEQKEAEMALRDVIQRMAVGHRFYGYRRIAVLVQREGYEVGTKKVRRLMKEDNLLAVRRRKFISTTDADHDFVVYPNLAEQLILQDVNQLWVADITYVRLLREFVYLACSAPAWENGRCESFLKTLKQEEIDARSYHTMEELEQHVAEFIEQIYNRVRLHSALGYLSPAEFESRPVPSGTVPAWLPAALSLRRHEEVPPLGQPREGQP